MRFESPKEKGSDLGYLEKSGKKRRGKWEGDSQVELSVSNGLVEPKPLGSSFPEGVTEEDIRVEISPLSSDTISFLRQVSGNGIPTTLWSPEILRGLREAGLVVESITGDPSPDSSIGVVCTDTRNRLQEFVLNPREARSVT
jgi:hypothetical protein